MKLSRLLFKGFRMGAGVALLLWTILFVDKECCQGRVNGLLERVKSEIILDRLEEELRLNGEISYTQEDSTFVALRFRWII